MKKSFILTCLVLLLTTIFVNAQTQDKTELERERQEIQKELKEIQGIYDKVKGQRKETVGQLSLLQKKIKLQDKYISSLNKELRFINDDIYFSTLEINRLHRQLDTLKLQYSRSVVYAYKNRSTYDYINFIFSSSNFNDALKRIAYLKSYRTYREKQVENIFETQQLIEQRKQQQINRKSQKNVVLQTQTKEVKVLEDQRREKDAVVSKLKSKEKELQKQIADKRKKDGKLKNAIAAIIRREIDEARKEAALKAEAEKKSTAVTNPGAITNPAVTKPASKPKSYLDLNEKDMALNSSFEKNKGRLPWPVDNGFVSINFGTYKIEGTQLKGDNPGLTISTPSAGVPVKSVFDGEVVGVYNLGDGMVVTIRHGKYFTSYSNLSSVSVGKGDAVKTGQSIARAAAAEDGSGGQIDFLLMIEKKEVNPAPWLRK